jgi:hypothetical protein
VFIKDDGGEVLLRAVRSGIACKGGIKGASLSLSAVGFLWSFCLRSRSYFCFARRALSGFEYLRGRPRAFLSASAIVCSCWCQLSR